MVAGLQLTSTDFAVLPPHFTAEGLRRITAIGLHNFFDCYNDFPDTMKGCCPYLLASVIYHLPTLIEWWPEPNHPVWQSKMFIRYQFQEIIDLREFVITGNFRDPDSEMTATGVPNVVRIYGRFDLMESRFERVEN